MTSLVMFDLDGTLVDTAPEIADAVNRLLADLGRPPLPLEQVVAGIGHGTRDLLRHVLALSGVTLPVEAVWESFSAHYDDTCGTRGSVYPGVAAALAALRSQGRRLAVVTNKEGAFAHRVLQRHGLSPHFELVVAGDSLASRKPDPAVIEHVLDALGAEAREALFVGDSAIDVATARAAGVAVWAVSHGYHHGALEGTHAPDRLIDHFAELGELADARLAIG